jgi:hypothetical protein
MGEPLFDGITAAVVSFGVAAVFVLRSAAAEVTDVRRAFRLGVAGHLLLGVSASLLLYRWIDGVMELPMDSRPNFWRSGGLVFACGMGLVVAVKAVIGQTIVGRANYLAAAIGFAEAALLFAGVWRWALLLQVLLFGVLALAKWFLPRAACDQKDVECDGRREPVLVVLVSSALLLLLLGTWQHVIKHETQRTTRSTRYSAWPRATALKDAWERTGWTAKPDDDASAARVADMASREQCIALGLGTLLLVVVTASLRRAGPVAKTSEADHAG